MCSHRTSHVYHFYIMNTLIFLCAFICWTNLVNGFVSTVRRSNEEEEENEQRIVVKKLANMIRQNSEKLIDESSQNEDVEYDESIDTLPNDENLPTKHSIRISNEDYKNRKNEPFAVPPTDPRYYQKSFSMDVKPLETPSALTRGTSSVTISDKSKPLNETEEEIQRRKLYAHLTLYPSFIPYGQVKSIRIPPPGYYYNDKNATNFLALTYGTVCALLVICTGATYIFFRKFRKTVKDAEDVDYPAYGVTGPSKETPAPTGDRHLAHSAQMYHYQHQKQQIVAMEKNSSPTKGRKGTESGSEEDDMTVYECPGLAPVTGEMEVNNPMFQDEDEVKIPNTPGKEQNQNKKTHLEVKKSQKK